MSNMIPKRSVSLVTDYVKPFKKVAIYCRVSTTHESQEESQDIQIETLKNVIASNPKWSLYKIYTDRDSGGNLFRPRFQELILIVTKTELI
jgi:DNA invertase Pin-like site-specific DNA recombinase